MRPLVLRVKGLRSYREEAVFDFSERDLVAIIGDTGAGKSSILEAITYALYGGATWSRGVVKDLIGSNETAMSVVFTFRADNETWSITRTARSNTGPPAHLLVSLDDDTKRFDGASAVNKRVEELVGLDYDGFLRAVILPQGKFQELLQSTPSDRNRVLKGIFRVDELEYVRELARGARDRMTAAINEAKVQRASLLPDPWRVADEATALAATSRDRLAVLDAATAEIASADADARAATGRVAVLNSDIADIGKARRPGDSASIQQLMAAEAALALRTEEARARQVEHEAVAEKIAEELESADGEGLGEAGLSSALATLEAATREFRRLAGENSRIGKERVAHEESAGQLASLAAASESAASALVVARAAVTAAEQDEAATRARFSAARDALRSFRLEQGRAVDAVSRMETLRTELASRQQANAAATAELAAAEDRLKVAKTAFEEATSHSHAAAAAAGHGPGDPCPVCARKLPPGFTPPAPEDDAEARAALDSATETERSARANHARAEARLHDLESQEASIIAASESALASLESAQSALLIAVPGGDLSASDATLLGPLDSAQSAAEASLVNARNTLAAANSEATRAASAHAAAVAESGRREADIAAATSRFEADRAQLVESLQQLPAVLQPPYPPALAAIAECIERANQLLQGIRSRAQERTSALASARQAEREQQQLRQELEATVHQPLAQYARAHAALSQCLATVAGHLGVASPTVEFPAVVSLAADAVTALDRAAASLIATSTERIADAESSLRATQVRIDAALASVECDSVAALRQATVDTAATLQRAESDLAMALRQQPRAAELDTRLANGSELNTALSTVYTHLSDANFIDFVIRERQKILLVVATEILGPMTGGRYGFADDFRVVDKYAGQAREVKTLSGGETFLASLALALALIELAGRGGGRLEALFLDEGFGSLDANTLPEALKALEKQASGGRLVAVISHLRAVAESIDHVLLVTRDQSSGSTAHWLTPAERESLLSSDAESGLLS